MSNFKKTLSKKLCLENILGKRNVKNVAQSNFSPLLFRNENLERECTELNSEYWNILHYL
jgi:hypothetical protein